MAANHDDETRERMLNQITGQIELTITSEMEEVLRDAVPPQVGVDWGRGRSWSAWSAGSWSNASTTTDWKLPGELHLKLSRELMRRYADDLLILADRMDENGDEEAAKEIRDAIQAAKEDVVDYLHKKMDEVRQIHGVPGAVGRRSWLTP